MAQLVSQAIGSASITVATLLAAVVLMYAVKATGTLRVSKAGEIEGLDVHEHGLSAYPEFSVHGSPSLTPAPAHAAMTMPSCIAGELRNGPFAWKRHCAWPFSVSSAYKFPRCVPMKS